jgi:serine/threonine protein kinase
LEDKFIILKKINEGGFGKIYLAENKFSREKVAVKVN